LSKILCSSKGLPPVGEPSSSLVPRSSSRSKEERGGGLGCGRERRNEREKEEYFENILKKL